MRHKIRIYQALYPYHIFNRTNNKEFIFDPDRDFPIFMSCLKHVSETTGFRPHHFALLYNHYHLIGSTPGANLSEVMCVLQATVSRLINLRLQRINHVFGSRYGAVVVKTQEYQSWIIHYTYHNATKSKLVLRPADYPYSTLQYYFDGSWKSRGLFLDPFLEQLTPTERFSFLTKLNEENVVNLDFGNLEQQLSSEQVI